MSRQLRRKLILSGERLDTMSEADFEAFQRDLGGMGLNTTAEVKFINVPDAPEPLPVFGEGLKERLIEQLTYDGYLRIMVKLGHSEPGARRVWNTLRRSGIVETPEGYSYGESLVLEVPALATMLEEGQIRGLRGTGRNIGIQTEGTLINLVRTAIKTEPSPPAVDSSAQLML